MRQHSSGVDWTVIKCLRGLPALIDSNSQLLILGSFPSEESLKRGQYCADPRNQFWKIIERVFGIDRSLDISVRSRELLKRGIALWDVLESCCREGSSDKEITEPMRPNDLKSLLENHCSIQRVVFNGKEAKALVERFLPDVLREVKYGFEILPSSSPNNRSPLRTKENAWRHKLVAR